MGETCAWPECQLETRLQIKEGDGSMLKFRPNDAFRLQSKPVTIECDRSFQTVWHIQRVWFGYPRRVWAACGEGVRAVTAQHLRQLPEGIGDHPQVVARCCARIEGLVILISHARHHQRAARPDGSL
jgi:hypothetical protein